MMIFVTASSLLGPKTVDLCPKLLGCSARELLASLCTEAGRHIAELRDERFESLLIRTNAACAMHMILVFVENPYNIHIYIYLKSLSLPLYSYIWLSCSSILVSLHFKMSGAAREDDPSQTLSSAPSALWLGRAFSTVKKPEACHPCEF